MKISNRQIILNVLNEKNDWMPLWDFIKVETKWGWLGTSARSRIQELAEKKKDRPPIGFKAGSDDVRQVFVVSDKTNRISNLLCQRF